MNILLFGGSFNPVHKGHVEMIRAAAALGEFDALWILPDHLPPHKPVGEDFASDADRVAMCELMASEVPGASVCTLEIERGGLSYMIDTVTFLQEKYPNDRFSLLVGGDMAMTLESWHRGEELLGRLPIVAVGRSTVSPNALKTQIDRLNRKGYDVRFLEAVISPVSSTEVRKAIAEGKKPEGLPEKIARYIQDHALYQRRTPMTNEEIIENIKSRLTPKRFYHSLCVADEAKKLALRYGEDEAALFTAGLLHDAMKDSSKEEQLKIMSENGILLSCIEKKAVKLWHAIAGEVFARTVAGVTDERILSAIRYHTTAKAGMTDFEKILYIADFTSLDRDYEGVEAVRAAAEIGLDTAMIEGLAFTVTELGTKRCPIHPDTIAAYNEIVLK